MPTVVIWGIEAKVESGTWTSSDNDLENLLNQWTENQKRLATIDSPFFTLNSPSDPYHDMTIAQAAAEAWDGEVTDEGTPPKHEPDRLY